MMYWTYGPMWHGSFLGGFFSILISVAIVVLIIALLRRGGMRHRRWGSSALSILEERYAKGEIGKEEFEERRRVLLEH